MFFFQLWKSHFLREIFIVSFCSTYINSDKVRDFLLLKYYHNASQTAISNSLLFDRDSAKQENEKGVGYKDPDYSVGTGAALKVGAPKMFSE